MPKGNRGGRRQGSRGNVVLGADYETEDLISMRETKQSEVDSTLEVLRRVNDEYGVTIDTQVAKVPDGSTMAYYDGTNIAVSEKYFNSKLMNSAYDECVKDGFHPGRGKYTGMEAVVAHEYGHALTKEVGAKLGLNTLNLNEASAFIVKEARKSTGHRGVVIMARKISRYATSSNAEAIAEAVCDCYCNGNKAKAQSKAIKSVLDKYLK